MCTLLCPDIRAWLLTKHSLNLSRSRKWLFLIIHIFYGNFSKFSIRKHSTQFQQSITNQSWESWFTGQNTRNLKQNVIVVCDIRIEIECELWLPFAFGKWKKMERKDGRYHFFFTMITTLQRTLDTNTVYLLQLHFIGILMSTSSDIHTLIATAKRK